MRRLPFEKRVKLVEPLDVLFECLLAPAHRAGPSTLVRASDQALASLLNLVLQSDPFVQLTSFPCTDSAVSYHIVDDPIESPVCLCSS